MSDGAPPGADEVWGALTPERRVAVFEPGQLADAAVWHELAAWGQSPAGRFQLGFEVGDTSVLEPRVRPAAAGPASVGGREGRQSCVTRAVRSRSRLV